MYQYKDQQAKLFKTKIVFGGQPLNPENRWIKLSQLIPWDEIEVEYAKNFDHEHGVYAFSGRVAFGCLILKEYLKMSDRETVEHIKENPYLQFFLGFETYNPMLQLNACSLTRFRQRFDAATIDKLNRIFVDNQLQAKTKSNKDQDNTDDTQDNQTAEKRQNAFDEGQDNDTNENQDLKAQRKAYTIILDATCAPADIQYPTDVRLLHESRLQLEKIIDWLHAGVSDPKKNKKPRSYRLRANREYKGYVKKRRHTHKERRRILRRQLGYVKRNLKSIKNIKKISNHGLTLKQKEQIKVIEKLYEQQQNMYIEKNHRCSNRIVSLHQPHVRPIHRGKARAKTEFGAKLSTVLVNGYSEVSKISWDAYNESTELIDIANKFKSRYNEYPVRILADKIYRTRKNLQFCKENNIHLNGPALGKPPSDKVLYEEQKQQEYRESAERNAVEGKFGEAKTRYALSRLKTRLKNTSETQIMIIFFVMNLQKAQRAFLYFLKAILQVIFSPKLSSATQE